MSIIYFYIVKFGELFELKELLHFHITVCKPSDAK